MYSDWLQAERGAHTHGAGSYSVALQGKHVILQVGPWKPDMQREHDSKLPEYRSQTIDEEVSQFCAWQANSQEGPYRPGGQGIGVGLGDDVGPADEKGAENNVDDG